MQETNLTITNARWVDKFDCHLVIDFKDGANTYRMGFNFIDVDVAQSMISNAKFNALMNSVGEPPISHISQLKGLTLKAIVHEGEIDHFVLHEPTELVDSAIRARVL